MAADSTIDLIVNQKASFRATFFLKNNLNERSEEHTSELQSH